MRLATTFLIVLLSPSVVHATIRGTVVTDDGTPIRGASVVAYPAEGSREWRQRLLSAAPEREPMARVVSGDDGAFQFDSKNSIALDLLVAAPGLQILEIAAVAGQDLGNVVLRRASLWGLEVTAGGKPVAGARIVIGRERVLTTDANGETGAQGWFDEFLIIHPDHAMRTIIPRQNGLAVTVAPGVEIRGRVVDGQSPVAGAMVSVSGWPLAKSGDDGTFVIPHAPTSWSVVTSVAGGRVAEWNRRQSGPIELRLAPAARIGGTVRDSVTGSGVAGARVLALAASGIEESVLTDNRGNFQFEGLPPANYRLVGTHPDYGIAPSAVLTSGFPSLDAQPLAHVSGSVVDEGGQPVGQAAVMTNLTGGGGSSPLAFTDKAGRFSLAFSPIRNVLPRLFASKQGFVTGASPGRALKPGERLSNWGVTIARGFPLRVRVLDGKRKPVQGARVLMLRMDDQSQPVPVGCDGTSEACQATDAAGEYPVRIVEGTYDVHVMTGKSVDKHLPSVALTRRSSPLEIVFEEGVELSGRVLNSDGTPAAGALIEVRGSADPGWVTAADGTFVISQLPPGKLTLIARSPDHHLSSAPVDVAAPARNVSLTLPKGGRIEGRVLDRATRRPLTDFSLVVTRGDSGDGFALPTLHSDDGTFVIPNVPPGPTTLRIAAPGYVQVLRAAIQVDEGKTVSGVEVPLDRSARLTGRVTAGGSPVANVMVGSGGPQPEGVATAGTTTDADGAYVLDGMAPGERSITFRKPGFVTQTKSAEIAEGRDAKLDIRLDRGRSISGRVVTSTGQPVAGASLFLSGDASTEPGPFVARSDNDGAFAIDGLAEGHYAVTARRRGFLTARLADVDPAQGAAITLTLEAGGSVSGSILGLPASDLVNATVYASVGGLPVTARPDLTGAFTLRGLADGPVGIEVYTERPSVQRRVSKTVTVEHGVAPPVEIDFSAGITIRGHVTMNGEALTSGSLTFQQEHWNPSLPGPGIGHISPGGTYEIAGLVRSVYDVRVSGMLASGVAASYRVLYAVSGNATFDIDIRGATMSGRVVDAKTAAPIAGASVGLSGEINFVLRLVTSDSEGRFVIAAVQEDRYELSARRDPYAPSRQSLVVSGGVIPEMVIRMEAATPITIHVVDALTGRPIGSGVMIARDGKQVGVGLPQIGEGVQFYLSPGTYEAHASAEVNDYVVGKATFTVPGGDQTIALIRGARLLIRSASGGHARLVAPGIVLPVWPWVLAPGNNGPFTRLPPGAYTLELLGPHDVVVKSVPVKLAPLETTIVDL